MFKKLLIVFTVTLLILTSISQNVLAKENMDSLKEGEIEFNIYDLDLEEGKSYVLYEDYENKYKIIIDVLSSNDTINMLSAGNSGWSGGTIPKGTHTLYPHIEGSTSSGMKEVGFYETVTGTNTIQIVDAYNANINNTSVLSISDVNLKVVYKTPTSSRPAKASLTYIAKYTATGGNSTTCYLHSEINQIGQHKITWKLP